MSNEEMDVSGDSSSENEEEEKDETMDSEEPKTPKQVYLPGQPLEEGETLVYDPSSYVMYHQARTGDPCLSFDIIPDNLGDNRETFPMTSYIVSGTQSSQSHVNHVIVMKLSKLNKISDSDNEDDEDSDEEDTSEGPDMKAALIKHQGCVNRIRSTRINGNVLAATWSELGNVNIFDIMPQLQVIESDQALKQYNNENKQKTVSPLYTFSGHKVEGFALDWSPTKPGALATGDCNKDIHLWQLVNGMTWQVDQRPLIGHQKSVEDLQWSPNEESVLASCSADASIRIWDTRASPNKACMLTCENAHQSDVNVINWNKNEPFIVSGGDDGFLHIWDLRIFHQKSPLATFKYHSAPVTSVEWHPTDSPVFASAGADDQIALWDLSIEKDDEAEEEEVKGCPPQLLFIHQGQKDIKELHWHKQLPGVIISTAESDFNIFRSVSV